MMTIEDTRYISLNTQHGLSRPSNGTYVKTYLSHIDFQFTGLLKEEQDILYNHVDIVNCQIPVSFYNVNYASNVLKYSINSGTINTLTIPVGNYSIISLKSEITSQFLNAGYTFTITFNESTNKYLFSSLLFSFSFFSNGSTILETIGFDSVANYTAQKGKLYSEHCVSLIGIKKLKISSVALATSAVSSGGGGDLLGIIPVNAGPRQMITYSNSGNRKALLKNRIVDNIDIIITDENNKYVNFNNNEYSITLAITTTRIYKNNVMSLFSNIQKPVIQNSATDTQVTTQDPVPVGNFGKIQQNEQSSYPEPPRIPFIDETDLDYFLYKKGISTG